MNLRRLQVIEAMNFCERRGWTYVIHWTMGEQYKFMLPYAEQQKELRAHLKKWEESE